MRMTLAAAGLDLLLSGPAAGQEPTVEDVKINQLIVYGEDACPPSTDEEITVCARKPESERYRVPENLRDNPNDRQGRSWADRASELQYVGRTGIGSCSAVGPGGMMGCFDQLVRQARAERASREDVNWNRLIEEARRERLARIDAEAEAAEREAQGPR